MKSRGRFKKGAKRRTTLTLPSDTLSYAEHIARARKVNLSSVIAEALAEGLRAQRSADRSRDVLKAYQRAFSGFSERELALLDGIVLEPADR